MDKCILNVRLRMVIVKNGKVLASYTNKRDFYYYMGGHLEFGETVLEGCKREVAEECGEGTEFTLKKVLYVRDFFDPKDGEQNVELFILGEINKFEEIEHYLDSQHQDGSVWLTWLDIENLPDNLYPQLLSEKLLEDYKKDFPNGGKYVGRMDGK